MPSKHTFFYPLLVTVFIFFLITPALAATNGVVYVAGDGSGDYNCKNDKNAQVQINQALKLVADNPGKYTTVHIKGSFTYEISEPLYIGSNTILEGDSTAVLKLTDHAGWAAWVPLISQFYSGSQYIEEKNIVIRGFTVDANYDGNGDIKHGKGYYNVIRLIHCQNITVNNMYMYDGAGDGLRANYCKNIKFYNNTIYKLGHDGCFAVNSEYVEAWNNHITCRTNSGLRLWNTDHVKFHDNLIESFYHWSAGGSAIQIEKSSGTMTDVEVYNNTMHNTYGPGIWLIGYSESHEGKSTDYIHIHHNIFYDDGENPSIDWVGGILTSGYNNAVIEKNVFDGNHNAGIIVMCPFDGLLPPDSGYKIYVKNNIIMNTQQRSYNPSGTGYGLQNDLHGTHEMVLDHNCLYKNVAGNYNHVSGSSDVYTDPLFVDAENRNYQFQAASPYAQIIGAVGFNGKVPEPDSDENMTDDPEPDENESIGYIADGALKDGNSTDVVTNALYFNLGHGSEYLNIITMEVSGSPGNQLSENDTLEAFQYYVNAPEFVELGFKNYLPDSGENNTTN